MLPTYDQVCMYVSIIIDRSPRRLSVIKQKQPDENQTRNTVSEWQFWKPFWILCVCVCSCMHACMQREDEKCQHGKEVEKLGRRKWSC